MTIDAYHVIMAGGSGTRFWPVSRAARPKQFLALAGPEPLIRMAWDRAVSMSGPDRVYVAAGAPQRDLVLAALPGLDPTRFVAEPVPRNTAPCVGLAALSLRRRDPRGVMVAAPADHIYTNPGALAESIGVAVEAARATGALVTLGIRPSRAETGFGYIEVGEAGGAGLPHGAKEAVRFVEKPDAPTARGYLSGGRHLWNSGVFVWTVEAILEEIRRCAPDLWAGLEEIDGALGTPAGAETVSRVFDQLAPISIDYAVMERASRVIVVPTDPGWSDVGSWDAAADLAAADAAGNAAPPAGPGEVLALGSRDTFVYPASGRLVALVNVEDLVIVDAPDALLICRRGDSQSVRAVVEALKARGRSDLL